MSSKPPKLRGHDKARHSLYPLGEFPDDVVIGIGGQIVHRLAVGYNISGDDFAEMFADSISGTHFNKPLGVTDVIWNSCSWSVKTVQAKKPFKQPSVRLITGRNSPAFSYGISDPKANVEETGAAVLNIWNERVNQSFNNHDDLRIVVLVRNMSTLEFVLFEFEAVRYPPFNYKWEINRRGNFEGFDKGTNKHRFTWQPHGSQFTVIEIVPGSAYKFRIIRRPGIIERRHILNLVRFKKNWIERVF